MRLDRARCSGGWERLRTGAKSTREGPWKPEALAGDPVEDEASLGPVSRCVCEKSCVYG